MKDKLIFRKNMLTAMIIAAVVAVFDVAFLIYFTFNMMDEGDRLPMIIALCMFIPVFPGLALLLFNQYLRVNDETVTFCKLFKRKQIIDWKYATVTQSTQNVNGAVMPTVVITDGAQEIVFPAISNKDLAYLNELCKTAHESYNPDDLTF